MGRDWSICWLRSNHQWSEAHTHLVVVLYFIYIFFSDFMCIYYWTGQLGTHYTWGTCSTKWATGVPCCTLSYLFVNCRERYFIRVSQQFMMHIYIFTYHWRSDSIFCLVKPQLKRTVSLYLCFMKYRNMKVNIFKCPNVLLGSPFLDFALNWVRKALRSLQCLCGVVGRGGICRKIRNFAN